MRCPTSSLSSVPLRARAGLAAALLVSVAGGCRTAPEPEPTLPTVVYLTDFGVRDGAVSAMKGVARGVEPRLALEDLTHGIRPFDVWEAAYRLRQTAPYWPAGTVFVCVVDPGVGTARRSVAVRTASGHLFVTPDNGTLTLVDEELGIVEAHEIDPSLRLPGSERSATFHGRDVYSLAGALLASGRLALPDVGPALPPGDLVRLDHPRPAVVREGDRAIYRGIVPVLDPNFGNVWTDLPAELLGDALSPGAELDVRITHGGEEVLRTRLPWVRSFGDVPVGSPLAYANSLGNVAFALDQASFAERFGVAAGRDWVVEVELPPAAGRSEGGERG